MLLGDKRAKGGRINVKFRKISMLYGDDLSVAQSGDDFRCGICQSRKENGKKILY